MNVRTKDGKPAYYAPSRAAWRRWLAANHASSRGVWLIYYKKGSGKTRVDYADAVEEALCFGWIDSLPNKIDDERYMQLFAPRKPKSAWSKLNKERVAKLIEQGLMTEAGLEKVELAKQNGAWTVLDAIERLEAPADLVAALAKRKKARATWDAYPPSVKKGLGWWIESAKRPETRKKRIAELIAAASAGHKPAIMGGPKPESPRRSAQRPRRR